MQKAIAEQAHHCSQGSSTPRPCQLHTPTLKPSHQVYSAEYARVQKAIAEQTHHRPLANSKPQIESQVYSGEYSRVQKAIAEQALHHAGLSPPGPLAKYAALDAASVFS